MTEVLFSEPANHYFVSGRVFQETFLYAVTSSEVTVISKVVIPGTFLDSRVIMQATKLGDEGTFNWSPLIINVDKNDGEVSQSPEQMKESLLSFITQMEITTNQVEDYITEKEASAPQTADKNIFEEEDSNKKMLVFLKQRLAEARTEILES